MANEELHEGERGTLKIEKSESEECKDANMPTPTTMDSEGEKKNYEDTY